MEESIRTSALQFVETMRSSHIYKTYVSSADALKAYPGVFERIMDLRRQTVDLYSQGESGSMENVDSLELRYEELQKIPEVNAFLEAEEDMIRLLKELNRALFTAVDLYLPEIP